MVKKGFSQMFVFLSMLIVAILLSGLFFISRQTSAPVSDSVSSLQEGYSPTAQGPFFSGKVKKISKDLELFKISESDKENNILALTSYYEAGTYISGELKGYTRILAIRPFQGYGPSIQFILATKDYKKYVLNDPGSKSTVYPESDPDNPYLYIDKNKISKALSLPSEHPTIIDLGKPYGLIKSGGILTEGVDSGIKDKSGKNIFVEAPKTEFDQSTLLDTPTLRVLTLYAGIPEKRNNADTLEAEKKYLHSTTAVYVKDSTGLTFEYNFSTMKDIDAYRGKVTVYEKALVDFKKKLVQFNEKKLKESPVPPKYLSLPSMEAAKLSSELPNDYYDNYDSAFPVPCGGDQNTYIVDTLTDDDLVKIESKNPYPLFILRDNKHPIYELAYKIRINDDDKVFQSLNGKKLRPTLEQYVSKHPLLFFKDTWGRWGTLGEIDYKNSQTCGG
jgi:hypothetical protein